MSTVSLLAIPAVLPLMMIFKESQVNWTTVLIFVIFVQSSIARMGKYNELKIDVLKLASLSSEKIKLIS